MSTSSARAGRRPLVRSRRHRWLGGVCGGIAEAYGWRPGAVRLAWLALTLLPLFPGLPAYLLLWIALPADRVTPA